MVTKGPKNFQKLLESQHLAVLATQSNTSPYTNLIAFSTTTTYRELLFATLKSTTKFQNIKTNKRVSILFDNRKNTSSDFSQAITATAIGTAREVDKQQYRDIFLNDDKRRKIYLCRKIPRTNNTNTIKIN